MKKALTVIIAICIIAVVLFTIDWQNGHWNRESYCEVYNSHVYAFIAEAHYSYGTVDFLRYNRFIDGENIDYCEVSENEILRKEGPIWYFKNDIKDYDYYLNNR